MIDSVLKGTGNSRFLKSAVPAGTSWADALAMLQAGTFPIDFNGINTDGFQQVGTPLNKANLLKDATAAQIGLPPSTTPDGMFQALGNTGELHVWRKATVSVEAGYNLGNTQKNYLASASISGDSNTTVTFKVSESVSVSVDGKVIQNNPTDDGPWGFVYGNTEIQNAIRGKFISVSTKSGSGYSTVSQDDIWFIPITANISFINNGTSLGYPYKYCYIADKMQKVSGFPAGTTTTYPVSTNPNAYQEGSDAKPAWYVVGEVVTGSFQMAEGYPSNTVVYKTANSISVGADGAIILNSPATASFNSDGFPSAASFLGKFIRFSHRGASGSTTPPATTPPFNTTPSEVVYIPASATITHTNGIHAVDRYQPVTGYPAIPASTTIEYLGKLGDKARVQVVSYVGTGTYGADNPNSLTFNFVPKIVMIRCDGDTNIFDAIYGMRQVVTDLSTGYYVTVKWSKKTLSWYSDDGPRQQMNDPGDKYYAIAII